MNSNTINSSLLLWEKVTINEADQESYLRIQAPYLTGPRFLKGSLAIGISESRNVSQTNIILHHKEEDLVIFLLFSSRNSNSFW